MPRTLRASEGGYCYHVLNRGNRQAEIFHKDGDYSAFLGLVAEASIRLPLPMLAYCLMPNHFHLVVRPEGDGDLSRWMHWLTTAHVRRYLRHYGQSGHVWQGRFKAFPCQDDDHLRTVVCYAERNLLQAGLVERAEDWPWLSLGAAAGPERAPNLDSARFERGPGWTERVNVPMTDAEAAAVSASIRRDRPFGSDAWGRTTAKKLGLQSSSGIVDGPPTTAPTRPSTSYIAQTTRRDLIPRPRTDIASGGDLRIKSAFLACILL